MVCMDKHVTSFYNGYKGIEWYIGCHRVSQSVLMCSIVWCRGRIEIDSHYLVGPRKLNEPKIFIRLFSEIIRE